MRIFFTGGGTLGPVTPLLATIEELKGLKGEMEPVWVGTRRGPERALVAPAGIPYHWIFTAKLPRYFSWQILLAPFSLLVAAFQSLYLVLRLRPQAIVGSGAYVQVPLVAVGKLLGATIILLQEDVEAGLSNRISAYDAKIIAAAFPAAVPQFPKNKVIVTGNPVRKLFAALAEPAERTVLRAKGLERWNLDGNRPTVLFLGGGTGALGINERVGRNLEALLASANVINIAGKGKLVASSPRQNYVAVEFLREEMAEAYAVADLVVSRAGLGTLTELGTAGLPTVLLPLLGHQEKNASYLAERKAVLVLKNDVADRIFVDTILRLVNDRERRLELSQAIAEIFPADAARKFAELILKNI